MDWAAFLREFGLPITILAVFAGAILTGKLLASVAVNAERVLWAKLVDNWKQRYDDEHALRMASEQRLDQILPAIADFTALARNIRDELIRGNPGTRRSQR